MTLAKSPTPRKTYGYYRVEILAALGNAVVLLILSLFIVYEAYRRFFSPPDVSAGPMLVVAVIGLGANAAGLLLLHSSAGASLNVQGAYLDMLSDTLGSLGVILAAVVILATGWHLADPLVAAGIGLFIIPRTWSLLRQAVDILLEATPAHIDLAEVERAIRGIPDIRKFHDLHIWTLTSRKYAMSGHVVVEDLSTSQRVLQDLHALLHDRFDIEHTTIQVESEPLIQIGRSPRVPPSSARGGPSDRA